MNAPLIHFGNGYTVQRNGPGLQFTIGNEVRPTGLEFNDVVMQLVHETEKAFNTFAGLVDQGAEQAEHIASLEAALGEAQSSTPRMDVLMVRCKEWMLREYGEAVTDDEVGRMFDHCLQGHYIPTREGWCCTTAGHYDRVAAAEQTAAQADAVSVGMGFIVHGVRVSPDDVTVLGGCKVVDDLRQAKKEALAALQAVDIDKTKWRDHSMILNGALWRMALTMGEAPEESDELFIDPQELIDRYFARETGWTSNGHVSPECHANAIECMNKRASAMEWINDFLGFGQGPDTSVDAACEWTLSGVRRVNKRLNELVVEAATVGQRLAQLCELVGLTPPSSKPAELYDMAFAILGLVNGKLRRERQTDDNDWCKATNFGGVAASNLSSISMRCVDADGKVVVRASRSSADVHRDYGIMDAAIEFFYAVARGVDIRPETLYEYCIAAPMRKGVTLQSGASDNYIETLHRNAGQPGGHVDPTAHLMDVNKPITAPAPGVSKSCGVCGAIFEGEGLFCALHANADLLGL